MATDAVNFDYKWGAISPSDTNKVPLKFSTKELAEHHATVMTNLIPLWDDPNSKLWNRDHWTTRPEPWIVLPL